MFVIPWAEYYRQTDAQSGAILIDDAIFLTAPFSCVVVGVLVASREHAAPRLAHCAGESLILLNAGGFLVTVVLFELYSWSDGLPHGAQQQADGFVSLTGTLLAAIGCVALAVACTRPRPRTP